MQSKVPLNELNTRMQRFKEIMNVQQPEWNMAVFFGKINQYYFTGTMQEGMLVIPRESDAVYWVRRSIERANEESLFANIRPMEGYREAAAYYSHLPETVYIETEIVPMAMYQRFQKYFPFKNCLSLDFQIGQIRAIKSAYEMAYIEKSGKIHEIVLEQRVPALLREGMSEAELSAAIYTALIDEGHQGLVRFAMFESEAVLGNITFGESSIYPTSFNGPGGNYGAGPSAPAVGSFHRKLKFGDLVFIDIGCGVNGYHTDKTLTYMFRKALPKEVQEAHFQCVDIQDNVASQLVPGAIPSAIYENTIARLSPEFLENFMGYGTRQVKFLGHGIGLTIDEIPVIAKGFDTPLEEGMVFALEPKKGIKDIGMVGIENTFIVTKNGGRCVTGNSKGLVLV